MAAFGPFSEAGERPLLHGLTGSNGSGSAGHCTTHSSS